VRALDLLERDDVATAMNVGTGTGTSVLEVVEATRRITGAEIPVRLTDRRPGDPVAVFADNSLARRQLGWVPRYGLDDIIATAWQWHTAHPDGYRS
jgi:UDP-glucose 4-epimerase